MKIANKLNFIFSNIYSLMSFMTDFIQIDSTFFTDSRFKRQKTSTQYFSAIASPLIFQKANVRAGAQSCLSSSKALRQNQLMKRRRFSLLLMRLFTRQWLLFSIINGGYSLCMALAVIISYTFKSCDVATE